MSIIEREHALIKRLNETDYEMFDGDREDALDFIEENMQSFVKYANVVIHEQIMHPIWRQRFEGQEYRDKVQDLDMKRRMAHERAIDSVNILNRMSNNIGIGDFVTVDTTDRHAVAEFVGKFVNETYNNGINNQNSEFDGATYEKSTTYDEHVMSEELRKLDAAYNAIHKDSSGMEMEHV